MKREIIARRIFETHGHTCAAVWQGTWDEIGESVQKRFLWQADEILEALRDAGYL
jgi:hypothetical protein